MSSLPRGIKNYYSQLKKSPIYLNPKLKTKFKRVNSVNGLREKLWDNRFIYDKIPIYDSFKDKNVLINLRTKSNSSRKKVGNTIRGNQLNFIDNSLYLFRPLSNKMTILHPLINGKKANKTISAKTRDINYKTNYRKNINNDFIFNNKNHLYGLNNKKYENPQKSEVFSKTKNNNDNNFNNINLINLNNIIKLWDELYIIKNYRKLFCAIYKELDDEDKEELYQRETNELISIKNDINTLKKNIELRLNTIKEIFELNKKLNTEIINKDNKSNENIINEISDKIDLLRKHTVNICKSMKKLKLALTGIKNLNKYDLNVIAEKFQFDKNYLIKMKGELNFLKEGFAKYYFNLNNDQTPFLLKTSEINKINNDKDPFYHFVPLDKELKNEIKECNYYIYQELIAYQNENANNKILRCISPLKRIILKNNEEEQKIINGKEENNKDLNSNDNVNIKNITNISNNNLINDILKKSSSSIENNIKIKDKNNQKEEKIKFKDNKDFKDNYNKKKEIIILKRNEKKYKTGPLLIQKEDKNDYKNLLLNYKINENKLNNRKSDINNKNNKIIIKSNKNCISENNNKNKESEQYLDKFLHDKNEKINE